MTKKPALYHPEWKGDVSIDGLEFTYLNPKTRKSFIDFNPVIILGGTLLWTTNDSARVNEAVRREREIFNALEMGNIVCITFLYDDLVTRVLDRLGIEMKLWEEPRADLVVRRSEFSSFLRKFGSAKMYFYGDFDDVICETEDEAIVGFAQKVEKGAVIFLPCYVLRRQFLDGTLLNEFTRVLLDDLRTYIPRIQYKPPPWIDSFRFPNEAIIVSEKEELQKEIEGKKLSLETYLRLKEILWFRDDELVNSVMSFFNEIGIKTKRDEIYEEDLWIVEQDKETVIIEVKGLDKNLKRPHISQLDEHRGAREKPDDFPALLVVNSFSKARSLKEKDVNISTNEIKKAVRTNVLILRTIDLCNAYSLMEGNKITSSQLLKVIKNETGWLKISASEYDIQK